MKKSMLLGVFFCSLLLMNSCSPEKMSAEEMMTDMEVQNEVMSMITEDQDMMSTMMDHIVKSENAMEMMNSSESMIHSMMTDQTLDHMVGMMDQDSMFCMKVMDKMWANERVKMMMMDMGSMDMESMEKGMMMDKEMMDKHMK